MTIAITQDEARLVCLTKEAIGAMNTLVVFLNGHQHLLPPYVYQRIIEADYMLNSSEDYYINDDPERLVGLREERG